MKILIKIKISKSHLHTSAWKQMKQRGQHFPQWNPGTGYCFTLNSISDKPFDNNIVIQNHMHSFLYITTTWSAKL